MTKLVLVLICEIGRPQIGMDNKFAAGKQDVVAKQVFWSTLRSLDKMIKVEQFDFENYPAIATKLVKFLSINTLVKTVEKLQSKASTFSNDIQDLRKEKGLAAKNSSTNSNKVTKFGPKLNSLTKQIKKLKQKLTDAKFTTKYLTIKHLSL